VLPQQTPQWAVSLELDDTGTDVFSEITQRLVGTGKLFAIVLDGQVLSAPTVNNPITNGQAEISGGFTQDSATELANQLQYGALPLSFTVAGVTLNGPTLAGSQLSAGVLAGIVGLALVVVYCMLYYRGWASWWWPRCSWPRAHLRGRDPARHERGVHPHPAGHRWPDRGGGHHG
jgi:preprotein translocase subunit SecD